MVKVISKGLKWMFFVNFVVSLVFGVLFFFLIEVYMGWLGIFFIAPFLFGGLFGGALLAFASASFFAWQQREWEKVKIIVLMNIVWNILGASSFTWVTISGWPVHPITLSHLIIFYVFLTAFILLYIQNKKQKERSN